MTTDAKAALDASSAALHRQALETRKTTLQRKLEARTCYPGGYTFNIAEIEAEIARIEAELQGDA